MRLTGPLNVWRVYLDLFSNLTGLVVIGGFGIMMMVGGAALHPSNGASAWEQHCQNGNELQTLSIRNLSSIRVPKESEKDCEADAYYRGLQFNGGGPNITQNRN